MKIKQKQLFKGEREFEIIDDSIQIEIKSFFNKEKLTLQLAKINPRPVLNGNELEFHDAFNAEKLFSLLLNNPTANAFDAFVHSLRQGILNHSGALTNARDKSLQEGQKEAPGWNVYDEPPDFEETRQQEKISFQLVKAERVQEDIVMLKTYLDERDIEPLLKQLEALSAAPQDEAVFQLVVHAYDELGFHQGAVLTYAPYLKILLSKYIGFQ